MTRFHYSVTATLPDEPTAARFIDWLANGHIADVVEAGAERGCVVRLDPTDDAPIRVEARYEFASRAAYEAYSRPGLRSPSAPRASQSSGMPASPSSGAPGKSLPPFPNPDLLSCQA